MALNAPFQGSAADVIKIAMVRLDRALAERRLASRLVLQVHDELVLEAPDGEVEAVTELVSEVMEGAAGLRVRLAVEVGSGRDWLVGRNRARPPLYSRKPMAAGSHGCWSRSPPGFCRRSRWRRRPPRRPPRRRPRAPSEPPPRRPRADRAAQGRPRSRWCDAASAFGQSLRRVGRVAGPGAAQAGVQPSSVVAASLFAACASTRPARSRSPGACAIPFRRSRRTPKKSLRPLGLRARAQGRPGRRDLGAASASS